MSHTGAAGAAGGDIGINSPQGSSRSSGDRAATCHFRSRYNKIFRSNFLACERRRPRGTWRELLSWRGGRGDEAETSRVVAVKALKRTGPRLPLFSHDIVPSPYFVCNGF